ncbi:3D domain-containing protein [Geobacillus thermodenitrificans]|jgi:3D (Asp-Asp-Asp) domain-containing protein|uniref:3D domain-containing protein n=1 Tax=Geobacillus thermodenitrificans TaxID=33940 RepID=UPI003D1FCB2D
MKKVVKNMLFSAALVTVPILYSLHVYQNSNNQLKIIQKQLREQQKLIKYLKQEIGQNKEYIKNSEQSIKEQYEQRFNDIEKKIDEFNKKYNKEYLYSFEGVVTAYSPYEESTGKSPDDPDFKVTASGTIATQGRTIAMDQRFPFGTLVKIEGFNEVFRVEDRGSKIKGNRIDLYFENVEDAVKFGKQKRKIYVIKFPKGVDKPN